ncbi:MAG: hypothetical protein EA424_08500 [Planctomycetaceae bacterium]|nr:MAG: hypothetical protein EA424_08500 [Planctomycetaceae bacterium]
MPSSSLAAPRRLLCNIVGGLCILLPSIPWGMYCIASAPASDQPTARSPTSGDQLPGWIADQVRGIQRDLDFLRTADPVPIDLAAVPDPIRQAYFDRLDRYLHETIGVLGRMLDDQRAALSDRRQAIETVLDHRQQLVQRLADRQGQRRLISFQSDWHLGGWSRFWMPVILSLVCFWIAVLVTCRRWWRMVSHRRSAFVQTGTLLLCLAVSVVPFGAGLWIGRFPPADLEHRSRTNQATDTHALPGEPPPHTERLDGAWEQLIQQQPLLSPSMRPLWQDLRQRLDAYQRGREKLLGLDQRIAAMHVECEELADEIAAASAANRTTRIAASLSVLMLWAGLLIGIGVRKWRVRWQCAKCGHWGQQVGTGVAEVPELRCEAKWVSPADEHTDRGDGDRVCGFTIEARRVGLQKLYVPLVGRGQVGKTLWLAAAYQSILFNQYDARLDLTRLKMGGLGPDQKDTLDEILEQIKKTGPNSVSPSVADLPEPVIFRFEDRDSLCRSGALLTVADFAGEVMTNYPPQHPLRRRMLHADGVMLFIQLQTPNRSVEENIEAAWKQIEAINTFVAQASAGSRTVPVAICVSMLDELLPADRDQKGEQQEFFHELARLERSRPAGRHRVELIEARHVLTQQLVRALWPGDLTRELNKLTGRQFRYFPVTSFGFNRPLDPEPESGKRPGPIKPWGELEPLLWILHMHGFVTFPHPRSDGSGPQKA